MTAPRVAGLIAAAGQSRRMGFPKSLLRYDSNDVFVTRIARVFLAGGLAPLFVTVPPEPKVAAAIRDALDQRGMQGVTTLENAAYARGLLGSIETARGAASALDAIVFTPTDAPFVTTEHVTALMEATTSGARGARLVVDGAPAHPAAISAACFDALSSATTARDVMRTQIIDVPAADRRLLAVLNTPEAYSTYFGRRVPA